jgi:hypothetical protein
MTIHRFRSFDKPSRVGVSLRSFHIRGGVELHSDQLGVRRCPSHRRITKLAADGHAIEAGATRPHFMECPQQKPTLGGPRDIHAFRGYAHRPLLRIVGRRRGPLRLRVVARPKAGLPPDPTLAPAGSHATAASVAMVPRRVPAGSRPIAASHRDRLLRLLGLRRSHGYRIGARRLTPRFVDSHVLRSTRSRESKSSSKPC